MKKFRGTVALSLLAVAAGSLASCGSNGVEFWTCFGAKYTTALGDVLTGVQTDSGVNILNSSKGSYKDIFKQMTLSIGPGTYPDLAIGYPDHFANYIASEIIVPFDSYFSDEMKNDIYEEYLTENYFVDSNGDKKLYGIPFNKSTEVFGYNGTFVEYCKWWGEKNNHTDWDLGNIPTTWQGWDERGDNYMTVYDTLIGSALYGKRTATGDPIPEQFKVYAKADVPVDKDGFAVADADGRECLIDMRDANKDTVRLISWDATDNAFITLIKQWGAKYTELPESQLTEAMEDRVGDVLFASPAEKGKVIECLKFFKKLQNRRIFNTPPAGEFSSDSFKNGQVMFMVCSSGGLSYNTKTPTYRFKLAPIPYYDNGVDPARKYVISQGANICMTDRHPNLAGDCWKIIEQLTRGKWQTEWCLKTGYYPCSKSAAESKEYQEFLHEADPDKIQEYATAKGITVEERTAEVYSTQAKVAYREGSQVNSDVYMDKKYNWEKFVDDAFVGSSEVRTVVGDALMLTFNGEHIAADPDDSDAYWTDVLNKLINRSEIKNHNNINIVTK